jgi:hypothetical protein
MHLEVKYEIFHHYFLQETYGLQSELACLVKFSVIHNVKGWQQIGVYEEPY